MNRCIICKRKFIRPGRTKCCTRVECRIKLSYIMLAQKGYDPVMYYEQILHSGYKVICKRCDKDFIARFKRDLFFPVCEDCEIQEKEIFWPLIDEINKEAVEEASGYFLPSSTFDRMSI
ncbi:hypothetical protein GF345_00320 [Candidatus Woesearchaeota archaeon]|nr:hypothetical protein [Candidatus Woesearchaeota archaeon]